MYEQGKTRRYEPKAPAGNRGREPSARVVVTIKTPTERQRRRIFGRMAEDDEGTSLTSAMDWQEFVVSEHVESIEHHINRGKTITTGAELAEFGETELVAELAAEIIGEHSLSEAEKKTSAAPSGSSPPPTPASTGTAGPADGTGSTSSEGAGGAA